MGYYNTYQISIYSGFANAEHHQNEIAKNAGCKNHEMFGSKVKGYGNIFHDKLKKHSIKYPEIIFCLKIIGEDHGGLLRDRWKVYYGKGKSQWCQEKRYYPEFDRTKLKNDD